MKRLALILIGLVLFCVPPVGAQNAQGTQLTAAVIKEQNVTFAVVVVSRAALSDKNTADMLIKTLEPSFGGIPVVLMAQDQAGTPAYYGRPDIAEFLSKVPAQSIPWKQ